MRDVMGRIVTFVGSAAPYQTVELDGATGMYVVTLRAGGESRTVLVQKR